MELVLRFVVPTFLLVSSSLNFISWIIFSSKKTEFKNSIYRLIKINLMVDAISALILATPFVGSEFLWYRRYHLNLINYVSRVLNLYSSVLGIQIIIKRFTVLKRARRIINMFENNNRTRSTKKFIFLQILIILVCILIFSPYLVFLFEVNVKVNARSTIHNVSLSLDAQTGAVGFPTQTNKNFSLIIILVVSQIVIHAGNFLVMITYSILSVIKIKENCRSMCKPESFNLSTRCGHSNHNISQRMLNCIKTKENNTNLMVSYICLIFMVNEFSALIGSIVGTYIRVNGSSNLLYLILFICMTIYILSNAVSFFIYKKFNKAFDRRFKKIFSVK